MIVFYFKLYSDQSRLDNTKFKMNNLQSKKNDQITCKTVISQKHFQVDGLLLKYTNIIKEQKVLNSQQSKQLVMKKYQCRNDGNKIIKYTQFIIKDTKYEIEDIFFLQTGQISSEATMLLLQQKILKGNLYNSKLLDSQKTNQSQKSNHQGQKVNNQSEKRNNSRENGQKRGRIHINLDGKSTKTKQYQTHRVKINNLPRIFCNAFKNYLRYKFQKGKLGKMETLFAQLKTMIGQYGYRKHFIESICKHQILRDHFKDFLENFAENWIKRSRIVQKGLNLDTIPIYKAFFNIKQLQNYLN